MSKPTPQIPPEFADYLRDHNVTDTRRRFGIGSTTISRWIVECGLADIVFERWKKGREQRPMPADFVERAPLESSRSLTKRYGAGPMVVARWRKECGIPAPVLAYARPTKPKAIIEKPVKAVRAPSPPRARSKAKWTGHRHAPAPQKDDSRAGRAQQHLQRLMPCFKASVIDKRRAGYVVAGRAMSADEMIAFAEAKGFDQRDWVRL